LDGCIQPAPHVVFKPTFSIGVFLDTGSSGGTINWIGTKSNNMNGSDCDGNQLDGFDYAAVLGSVGGNDADYVYGIVSFAGLTLADLDGAQIGIRATSLGETRDGSLKLTSVFRNDNPPQDDGFPTWPQDISNVVLYFNTTSFSDGVDKPYDYGLVLV
jgi:hypothetical protein